ncbi:MAG: ParB/RepB/Spo0J family partition protein [Alphaproteobacteria bacterium]
MNKNKILGKGLSALISENKIDILSNKNSDSKDFIDIDSIEVGKFQPRKLFNEQFLQELSDSISKSGVISPIIVRKGLNGKYQIIAGERRWRASKMAGLKKIPVIIKDIKDKEALELAIVENIQRQDLTAIEEAEGYCRLMEDFGYTQDHLAKVVGKSRSHIANYLRLLLLPDSIKDMVNTGALSVGHARALITSENSEALAKEILDNNLSVRDTEKLLKKGKERTQKTGNLNVKPQVRDFGTVEKFEAFHESNEFKNPDGDLALIEESLSKSLGMKVSIRDEDGEGKIAIYFKTLEQLDTILQKLSESI